MRFCGWGNLIAVAVLSFVAIAGCAIVPAPPEAQQAKQQTHSNQRVLLPLKNGENKLLQLEESFHFSPINLSKQPASGTSKRAEMLNPNSPLGGLRSGLSAPNYGMSISIPQGQYRYVTVNLPAGARIFATSTPTIGDPDLYLYRWDGASWRYTMASVKSSMYVDRLVYSSQQSEQVLVLVYGASTAGARFTLSWEQNGRLVLDVPYLNQNILTGGIGSAACSSASSAMVLAYHSKIKMPALSSTAHSIFGATANIEYGLLGREGLKNHLESKFNMTVSIDTSGWQALYATIQREIRAGKPLILGSKSMSQAGHYFVVTGFSGNQYSNAVIIGNDSNGLWEGYNSWSISSQAVGVEYDFTTITSNSIDGVFVIAP